jgi:hypothetical protein
MITEALTSFKRPYPDLENYRARLRADGEGMANFGFAEENKSSSRRSEHSCVKQEPDAVRTGVERRA